MKKIIIIFFFFLSVFEAFSSPGDTTIIQTFTFDQGRQTAWTLRDGKFLFPDGSKTYEKVLMLYTLKCDNSMSPACGEWDYIFNTTLKQHTGVYIDTNEVIIDWCLGNYITPYGYGIDLENGWTWVYDVTDFVHLLKDSVHLQDGNFQELLDLKFLFIEGIPPRNVLDIRNVWQGSYNLKDFDSIITDTTFTLNSTVKSVKLRTTVTGHGFGNGNNCGEFCENIHSVKANNTKIAEWQIIQNCSNNPLYPQGGTWIYNRAGWCPGTRGTLQEFDLTPYVKNNSINFDYDIETDPYGNYVTHIELVTYGDVNCQKDVSAEMIIAPTNDYLQSRYNPTCGNPIIVIKNTGSNALTDVDIKYYFEGGSSNSYHWKGNLAFMQKDTIVLPVPDWNELTTTTGTFYFELSKPNGQQDPTPYNNKLSAAFTMPRKATVSKFRLDFMTNHAPTETSWKISDVWGNMLYQNESNLTANTSYQQIMEFQDGCYVLKVNDLGEDGLSFWANLPPNGEGTSGSLSLKRVTTSGTSYLPFYNFNGDFGKDFQFYFAVNNYLGIKDYQISNAKISIYPNPTTDFINIQVKDNTINKLDIQLIDVYGRVVKQAVLYNEISNGLDISTFSNGIYFIIIKNNNNNLGTYKIIKSK